MSKGKNNIILYGKHTFESIICNKDREVYQVLCVSQNYDEITKFIIHNKRNEILRLVKVVNRSDISDIFPNLNHQSIAISCSKKRILSVDDLFNNKVGNILVLDQLTDPQNIGGIIRSSIAFGVRDIAVPSNSFPGETATMVKAASGNFEKARIYDVGNITNMLIRVKKEGYWCIGLAGEAKSTIDKVKDFDKIVIVVGSEGSGIRPLIKKNCDLLVKIPMESHVESLNAANAASVALYELYKNKL